MWTNDRNLECIYAGISLYMRTETDTLKLQYLLMTETPHNLLQKSTPAYTESAIQEIQNNTKANGNSWRSLICKDKTPQMRQWNQKINKI